MGLPSAYLTSTKNLKSILEAVRKAQAPKKFTNSFLESLEFKSSSDRLIIGVLKALGFLDANGVPTARYFQYLDETQSKQVLAEGMKHAYADLFLINTKANELSKEQVKNKLKTLTQGKLSDSVLEKMAATFRALAQEADFTATATVPKVEETPGGTEIATLVSPLQPEANDRLKLGGLVYNIQIHLPESRDASVYDALFKSLKEHLLT